MRLVNAVYYTLAAERVILTRSGIVYGVLLTNTTASAVTVTMQNTAGTTIGLYRVPANASFESAVERHYQDGVKFAAGSADVSIEVFTTNPTGSV